jgi:outer membrane protein TolC
MKFSAALVTGLLLLASLQLTAQTYSLEDYMSEVQQHNRNLLLAREEKRLSGVQEDEALAGALPQVGVQAGYTANLSDYFMYFDMSAFQPGATGTAKAPIKRNNEFSATVALQQTLFSPSIFHAITASQQYSELTDEAVEDARQQILLGSKKLFYQTILLQKVLEVSRASEANARDNYEIIQKKYDNGQVSQLELLLAETRWRNTVPATDAAVRNLSIAMNMVKTLAGMNLDREITLSGNLNRVPPEPVDVSIDQAFETRTDLRMLQKEAELRGTAIKAAKGSYIPTLSGTLALNYSAQSDEFKLDEENKLFFAGVTLSWPIYTGGYISAQVERASIELEKTKLKLQQTRDEARSELANIRLRLTEARSRITSAEATLKAAKKAFEIAETTTKSGLTTQLQLKDARMQYDQAQLGYYAAVYDYREAIFDWEHASGRMPRESSSEQRS